MADITATTDETETTTTPPANTAGSDATPVEKSKTNKTFTNAAEGTSEGEKPKTENTKETKPSHTQTLSEKQQEAARKRNLETEIKNQKRDSSKGGIFKDGEFIITGDADHGNWMNILEDFLKIFMGMFDSDLREHMAMSRELTGTYKGDDVHKALNSSKDTVILNTEENFAENDEKTSSAPPPKSQPQKRIPLPKAPTSEQVEKSFNQSINSPEAKNAIEELVAEIVKYESSNDTGLIFDYRNRLTKNGVYDENAKPEDLMSSNGLHHDYSKTHYEHSTYMGNRIPDITKMTLNEVQAWQQEYVDEQKALGIPWEKRSTAAGHFMFTLTRTRDLEEKSDNIHGDMLFDEAGQKLLAKESVVDIMRRTILPEADYNESLTGDAQAREQERQTQILRQPIFEDLQNGGTETRKSLAENLLNEWDGLNKIPEARRQELIWNVFNTSEFKKEVESAYNGSPPSSPAA